MGTMTHSGKYDVFDMLSDAYSKLYNLCGCIVIDKMIVLFKGRVVLMLYMFLY
jgi:hypothetical protein